MRTKSQYAVLTLGWRRIDSRIVPCQALRLGDVVSVPATAFGQAWAKNKWTSSARPRPVIVWSHGGRELHTYGEFYELLPPSFSGGNHHWAHALGQALRHQEEGPPRRLGGANLQGPPQFLPRCSQCLPQPVDPPDAAYTRGVIDGTYGETLNGHDGASRAHIAGSPPAAPKMT